MSVAPRTLFISAGETSGDMHAAGVIKALKQLYPEVSITGVAGQQMRNAGCGELHNMSELNVMGISDVISALPRIRRIEASILAWCAAHSPDAVILVDFSSFHMRLGRKLRGMGIPVLHYIAPKLWAWGAWRVRKLRQSQDALASILPFEPEWFARYGIDASYVGNPSATACRDGWSREELKQRLGVEKDQPLLAVLPGSRKQELRLHVPLLADAVDHLRSLFTGLAVVVPVAPGVDRDALEPLCQAGAVAVDRAETGFALRADAAIAVSGTATLELALWDVPTVLVYRSSALTMFLARRLVRLNCAGLANIILDDQAVMPELIQQDCTVERIVKETLPLLQGGDAASEQRRSFVELRRRLGEHDPAQGVVDMLAGLLSKKTMGTENH